MADWLLFSAVDSIGRYKKPENTILLLPVHDNEEDKNSMGYGQLFPFVDNKWKENLMDDRLFVSSTNAGNRNENPMDVRVLLTSVGGDGGEDDINPGGTVNPGDGYNDESVPLGEGTYLLILLVVVYVVRQRFRKTKSCN
ncbi:MAG: hypothetical protein LBR81_06780 [Prevotellaceae bacterium]|nr:hypothetical protein [Prevotellaceae bacterium]